MQEVRVAFHETLNESGQKLTALMNSHKKMIARAKPFYQARYEARRAYVANQKATRRFEKAISMHKGAMERVAVAEQNFVPQRETTVPFDSTWVEMLNQANDRVSRIVISLFRNGRKGRKWCSHDVRINESVSVGFLLDLVMHVVRQ